MHMSNSLASAKRRRAGMTPEPTLTPTTTTTPTPPQPAANGRMSLPQLLNNFENRLKAVEYNKQDTVTETPMSFSVTDPDTGTIKKMSLSDYMTDMDNKFYMLAEEITSMKDIIIKLQSFTMEVNKTLMEERVRILSEVPENMKIKNDDENADENAEQVSLTV